MDESEKPDFGARILAVGLMYEKQITKVVIDLYWSSLKDLPLKDIEIALQMHMRDQDKGRFMPKPADLRGFICKPEKAAVIAWSQVERAMSKHGRYQTIQFQDGVINAVVADMGGWPWICAQNLEEPWTQKEFERRYEAYRDQRIENHTPLVGIVELENRNRGFLNEIPDTKLIAEDGSVMLLPPVLPPKELAPADAMIGALADKMKLVEVKP